MVGGVNAYLAVVPSFSGHAALQASGGVPRTKEDDLRGGEINSHARLKKLTASSIEDLGLNAEDSPFPKRKSWRLQSRISVRSFDKSRSNGMEDFEVVSRLNLEEEEKNEEPSQLQIPVS